MIHEAPALAYFGALQGLDTFRQADFRHGQCGTDLLYFLCGLSLAIREKWAFRHPEFDPVLPKLPSQAVQESRRDRFLYPSLAQNGRMTSA
jgi:hypothetical protein